MEKTIIDSQEPTQEPSKVLVPVPVSFTNLEQVTDTETCIVSEPTTSNPTTSNPTIETQPIQSVKTPCKCTCFDPKSKDYDPRCFGLCYVCCSKPPNTYRTNRENQCMQCNTCGDVLYFYIVTDGMTPHHTCEDNACCTLLCFPIVLPLSVPFIIGIGFNKIMNIICCTQYENYLF